MKKRKAIGITITVIVLSVFFGINSIPDEVLSAEYQASKTSTNVQQESTAVQTSQNFPILPPNLPKQNDIIESSNKKIVSLEKEIKTLKNELNLMKNENKITNSNFDKPSIESNENEFVGNVIKVTISDGVGASLQ